MLTNRLWEGKGTSGHDPIAERYVVPADYVYTAPPVPQLSAEQEREQV
jgi:hypothetical protein